MSWGSIDIDKCMDYLGCMYGYDLSTPISKYTPKEVGRRDDCVRAVEVTSETMEEARVVGVGMVGRERAIRLLSTSLKSNCTL